MRARDKTLSEAPAFEPQLLAKFAVAMCEMLVERMRDHARRAAYFCVTRNSGERVVKMTFGLFEIVHGSCAYCSTRR